MVNLCGSLHPVNRKGKVRVYRLYIGATYHSFHATLAKGHKARLEAQTSMALNISKDKASPPIHVQGLLLRFSKGKRKYIYQGKTRQPGSDTKVYLGSSSDMQYVASKVASAKGQDVSACKRRKCMRMTPDDSMERCRLMAGLFKEWVPKDLFGPSRCGVRFP
jgi:hypothetical protein